MRLNAMHAARTYAPLLGAMMLCVMQFARAASLPPLPVLPPLPDQKDWDAAIARFSQDSDPKLAANKRLIMEAELGFAKSLQFGHVREIFEHYISPDYIQHNPNIEPGREGIIRSFESGVKPPEPKTKPGEPPPRDAAIPTLVIAQGDYVAMIFETELPDPADNTKTYSYKPTTIFRVKDGQIVEHWGGGPKGTL